jgi:SNF2 family DNA or RNA helicase
VDALREQFGPDCVAMFYGGNARDRDSEALRFTTTPECRFMVATQAAGGRGNTWINATQVVYFANTYNLEERVQSEDRCHRSGQNRHVTYTDLRAEDVQVDERLIKALRRKESISALLVGESAREWI